MNPLPPPASQKPSSDLPQTAHKIWKVGTLTYSLGGLALLFCWLLWGDFAWSMRDRAVPSTMQVLFKQYGASDTLAALLIGSLPAGLSMLISPIVSYKSDRHRGKWGRRIPYLAAPTPFIVLSIIGLAFAPAIGALAHHSLGSHSPGLNPSILVFLGLFWIVFELACITANSVFGALINDVVPHVVIGRFFALFRALSLAAGILFNYWLFGYAEKYFDWIFFGVSALYGVGFMLMCWRVKEGEYPEPPDAQEGERNFLAAAMTYLRDCFGTTYYVWLFFASAVAGIAFGPVNLFSVFFAKSIDMSLAEYGKCIAITFAVSLIIAYPLGVLADRFHPLRVSMVTLLLYVLLMGWAVKYVCDVSSFSIVLIAHGVLSGAYYTASASLNQRLLPQSNFAELSSAGGIIASLSFVLLSPILGFFLDATGHAYHYVYVFGLLLSIFAVLLFLRFYCLFLKRGS